MITRPLAGQRNLGSDPVPSADFTASLADACSATGAKTLALCGGSLAGSLGVAGACVMSGRALDLMAEARTPGITSRSPTLSLALG